MFVSTPHNVLFDIQFYSQSAALILKMLDIYYNNRYWLYSDLFSVFFPAWEDLWF